MKNPIYFYQLAGEGSDFPYPSKEKPDATGKTSGCGPYSFATVRTNLQDKNYTPIDAMKDSLAGGYRVNGGTSDSYFSAMAKKYDLAYEYTKDLKMAFKALQDSKMVICRMQDWFGPGKGHFITAHGVVGDKIQILDSASKNNTAKLWDQSVFTTKCIGYFIFSKPHEMTYIEALKICCQYVGYDEKYWSTKEKIDPCFPDWVKKLAKFLNTKGVK